VQPSTCLRYLTSKRATPPKQSGDAGLDRLTCWFGLAFMWGLSWVFLEN